MNEVIEDFFVNEITDANLWLLKECGTEGDFLYATFCSDNPRNYKKPILAITINDGRNWNLFFLHHDYYWIDDKNLEKLNDATKKAIEEEVVYPLMW